MCWSVFSMNHPNHWATGVSAFFQFLVKSIFTWSWWWRRLKMMKIKLCWSWSIPLHTTQNSHQGSQGYHTSQLIPPAGSPQGYQAPIPGIPPPFFPHLLDFHHVVGTGLAGIYARCAHDLALGARGLEHDLGVFCSVTCNSCKYIYIYIVHISMCM